MSAATHDLALAGHDGHGDHGDHGGHVTATGISNEKDGMWTFLGSECLLFGALIATFLVYNGRSINGPYLHDTIENGKVVEGVVDIPFTSASSFILLSFPFTWATPTPKPYCRPPPRLASGSLPAGFG